MQSSNVMAGVSLGRTVLVPEREPRCVDGYYRDNGWIPLWGIRRIPMRSLKNGVVALGLDQALAYRIPGKFHTVVDLQFPHQVLDMLIDGLNAAV